MQGAVIWITGLSGAGKTTLATLVVETLRSEGRAVLHLDGDELRAVLHDDEPRQGGFDRTARLALALRYCRLCRLASRQGILVVISTISMFREVHRWNRENLDRYYEVYLKIPIDELRRRDSKGIYSRADGGPVAGVDMEVDEPLDPDWLVEYHPDTTVVGLSSDLMRRLNEAGLL
jgi:adenylylsulfate kinase-like enzyme